MVCMTGLTVSKQVRDKRASIFPVLFSPLSHPGWHTASCSRNVIPPRLALPAGQVRRLDKSHSSARIGRSPEQYGNGSA